MSLEGLPFWQVFLGVFTVQYVRYVLLVSAVHAVLYVLLRAWTETRRVTVKRATRKDMWREARVSLAFIATVSLPVAFFAMPAHRGWTKLYFDAREYPLWWLPVTFVLLMFGQDTYFYWSHRLIHRRPLFRIIHALHHRSMHPTAFAAFAMHPFEAVVAMGFNAAFLFLVPTHFGVFAAYQVVSFALNVAGHCGVEVFPDRWQTLPILKHLNRPRAHAAHHKFFDVNYGLYFTIWDRWMGTFDGRPRPIDETKKVGTSNPDGSASGNPDANSKGDEPVRAA